MGQHGCFTDKNIHKEDTPHVTFAGKFCPSNASFRRVSRAWLSTLGKLEERLLIHSKAITFTFHPSNSSQHRFTSAIITISAKSQTGMPIRFLKFAPHLAFGRISSATLKWNFKLGATVGLSQGPAQATLDPSVGYEKNTVVGTMMHM